MLSLIEAAQELKLPHLREHHEALITEYTSRGLNFEDALTELLSEGVYQHRSRGYQKRNC